MRKLMLMLAAGGAIVALAASEDPVPETVVFGFALDTGAVPVPVEPTEGVEARYCIDTAFTGFEFNSDGLFHGGIIIIR